MRNKHHTPFILSVLALIMLALSLTPSSFAAAQTAPKGKLAFVLETRTQDKGPSLGYIYIIDVDGNNRRRLTQNDDFKDEYSPSFSPDAKQIAFAAQKETDGPYSLFVINSDGSDLQLLPNSLDAARPIWSLDGKYIAFARGKPAKDAGLYLYDMSTQTSKLAVAATATDDWIPSTWFSDSQHLLYFSSSISGGNKYFQVATDGGQPQTVTIPKGVAKYSILQFSPDGKQIAGNGENGGIVLFKTFKDTPKRVGCVSAICETFAWSPDSQYIAYANASFDTKAASVKEIQWGIEIFDTKTSKTVSIINVGKSANPLTGKQVSLEGAGQSVTGLSWGIPLASEATQPATMSATAAK